MFSFSPAKAFSQRTKGTTIFSNVCSSGFRAAILLLVASSCSIISFVSWATCSALIVKSRSGGGATVAILNRKKSRGLGALRVSFSCSTPLAFTNRPERRIQNHKDWISSGYSFATGRWIQALPYYFLLRSIVDQLHSSVLLYLLIQ